MPHGGDDDPGDTGRFRDGEAGMTGLGAMSGLGGSGVEGLGLLVLGAVAFLRTFRNRHRD